MFLQPHELRQAVRSELAAIEDEYHVFGPAMVAQRNRFVIRVGERKIRCFITNLISNNTLSATPSAKQKYNYQKQTNSVVDFHLKPPILDDCTVQFLSINRTAT